MKLEGVLNQVNSFEKNSFLKIIETINSKSPKNYKEIEKILSEKDGVLKNADNINIVKVFQLVENEFSDYVKGEFTDATSQLDILIDILIRDGNCIISLGWFERLYEAEIKKLNKKVKEFEKLLNEAKTDISENRIRDYNIYKECLRTAYSNDLAYNRECVITRDEQSILNALSKKLELSQEEVRLINYLIIPIKKLDIDTIIKVLKDSGVIFYSKKYHKAYVADEVVRLLRHIRGKEVADKHFRRVLKYLSNGQINLIAKKHNIDRTLSTDEKSKVIIREGISFSDVLLGDIFKDGTTKTAKKSFLNQLIDKKLKITLPYKGITTEDKVQNLIHYFEELEKEEKVGISIDGYEKLLRELSDVLPKLNSLVKEEFGLQIENALNSNELLKYNIKPRDILYLLSDADLQKFCKAKSIKTRGNLIENIIENYKDAENLYLENYESIAYRDLATLKEEGIKLKESELGVKFEELTKTIFTKLGLEVDEKLRRRLNTKKHKIDIILNLSNNELIIIECKTVKESGYNKFSSVSRQIKSYIELAKKKEYIIRKSLLVAPEFSVEFVNDCRVESEINLSLISASSLKKILDGFKDTKQKKFPYRLLLKDVLIDEDMILKAIRK